MRRLSGIGTLSTPELRRSVDAAVAAMRALSRMPVLVLLMAPPSSFLQHYMPPTSRIRINRTQKRMMLTPVIVTDNAGLKLPAGLSVVLFFDHTCRVIQQYFLNQGRTSNSNTPAT